MPHRDDSTILTHTRAPLTSACGVCCWLYVVSFLTPAKEALERVCGNLP